MPPFWEGQFCHADIKRKRTLNEKGMFSMKNLYKFKLSGIAVVLAIIFSAALLFTACNRGKGEDSGSGGAGGSSGRANSALNGTWVSDSIELTYNNGNFESSFGGSPLSKGTYTTSGSNYTSTTTHAHGGQFLGMLESRWYTKAEYKETLMGQFMPDADLDGMFGTETGTYSISGNKLTLSKNEGGTMTYTRK
jgi:predicted small secreted protein